MIKSRTVITNTAAFMTAGLLLTLGPALAGCATLPDAQRPGQTASTVARPVDQGTDRTGDQPAVDPTKDATGHRSGTGDTFGAGCKPDIVAEICVDIALTGKLDVTGDGYVSAPQPPGSASDSTCAAIAADGDGGNLGDHLARLHGHTVAWDATLTDYHGPGTYHPRDVNLTIDNQAYTTSDRGRATVAISPSFATVITLTDLQSADDPGATVTGRIVWTCIDPTSN